MTHDILLALILFAFTSSITPGPNNLMLMASGTNYGFRRTIPHLLGVSLGFVFMIIVVGMGLVQAFEVLPFLSAALKWISVGYLTYLAWKIASASTVPAAQPNAHNGSKPFTFIQAALFQWVNPKAWTMALTACSAYLPRDDIMAGLLIVAAVFGAINLPCVGIWTVLGVQMRRFLVNPIRLRVFNISIALLLLASLYPVLMD